MAATCSDSIQPCVREDQKSVEIQVKCDNITHLIFPHDVGMLSSSKNKFEWTCKALEDHGKQGTPLVNSVKTDYLWLSRNQDGAGKRPNPL